jgi:hypothetical protein
LRALLEKHFDPIFASALSPTFPTRGKGRRYDNSLFSEIIGAYRINFERWPPYT